MKFAFFSRALGAECLVAAALLSQTLPAGAASLKTLHAFQSNGASTDGSGPTGLMAPGHDTIYGTTQGGGTGSSGTVFKYDRHTGVETVLYSFQGTTDGQAPSRDVVLHDGMLYGTTVFGGQPPKQNYYNETGTIFSVDVATGIKTTLFEFPNDGSLGYAPGDVTLVGHTLYGLTVGQGDPQGATYYGTLFSFDLKTNTFTNLHTFNPGAAVDGGFPFAGLVYDKGLLYGTTSQGGNGSGTIFAYSIAKKTLNVLVSFGVTHGLPTQPQSTPVLLNGALYITSRSGGIVSSNYYGYGTVFRYDLATGAGTVLHSFQNTTDGELPLGGLVYQNGLLYGSTAYGGTYGGGTVFSIDPDTGKLRTLHNFDGTDDGNQPIAAMVDVHGRLFGTTAYGGAGGAGTVFRFDP